MDSWDTPFSPLEGDVASNGLRLDVREPGAYAWSGGAASFLGKAQAATAANLFSDFTNGLYSTSLIADGRAPNLLEYWSAGAPNWYGGSQRGRVALHWRLFVRPVAGRSWFDLSANVAVSLAFAGNGYVRCTKTLSGATTDLNMGSAAGFNLTEADWIDQGYRFATAVTLAPGDSLDVYYVQDREDWGGVVCKAVSGSTQTQALAAAAPVAGCGLFDTGSRPTKRSWKHVEDVHVQVDHGQAPTAVLTVPLVNPSTHDGFGWEWRQDSISDPGYLVCWDGGVEQFVVRRGRLVRVRMGYESEEETVFTGVIQDIPNPRNGTAQVRLLGFEHRLIEARNKLEPDQVSYMTAGYRKLTGVAEPVYGVTAYDAWTVEDAVADMAYRAGIDASRLRQPLMVRKADGSFVPVVFGADAFQKFRARSKAGVPFRLERPVHYGNVGTRFSESVPVDDEYLFAPESRDDSWARVLEIADRYGYDIRFDAVGDLVLAARANACFAYDIVAGDSGQASSRRVHPSAYRGAYQEWTVAPTVTKQVKGARLDVSLPRGAALGAWATITVRRTSDAAVVAALSNVDVTGPSDVFYYDYRTTVDGTNATILTLFSGDFDTYDVEFVGSGAATRRLDTLFVYHTDPNSPRYALSTAANALDVSAQDAGDEMRNVVTVVGGRKATVTDSEKLRTNPNNPDPEFVVEVAVDPASVAQPTAPNYIGMRKEAIIIDDRIADQDYAAYLARTVVYRYRTPRPPAEILHTLIAEVALRHCLVADEATFKSVQPISKLWVVGYTHSAGADGSYTTTLRTVAWPEFPSYEPRDDIDIDADFAGVPIANVQVAYTSCSGHAKVNLPGRGAVRESGDGDVVNIAGVSVTGGSPEFLAPSSPPWPPVPGTVAIRPGGSAGDTGVAVEEYPGNAGTADYSTGIQIGHHSGKSNEHTATFTLLGIAKTPITSVKVILFQYTGTDIPPGDPAKWVRQYSGLALGAPQLTFSYDPDENALTVRLADSALSGLKNFARVAFQVTYDKYGSYQGRRWSANTPYHHFVNVDCRDSNRKVYLPWKQGNGAGVYTRTGVSPAPTAYDLQYRRLGDVDGTGAYKPYYGAGSPFYDVTTSELGYLVGFAFDALVSGLYRISVRSLYDDTVVAYLTEPTADPKQPEAHWQYVTAGAGRTYNWDGVDQIGLWNRRQSEDYAALSQGWFEDQEKQAVGAGWYVWNREKEGGKPGRIALIADERNADGTPVYGVGTFAQWYFHVECRNETLAAATEAAIAAGSLSPPKLPRVARTREPAPGEAPPTYVQAADFARDNFTDTDDVLLQSHAGQLGAAWTKHPSYSGDAQVSDAGRLHASSSTAAMYYASGSPASADYDVSTLVRKRSSTAGTAGVGGRISTASESFYTARYNDNVDAWELDKLAAGSPTSLGSYSQALTIDQDYALVLRMRGSTISLLVDGVERVSATDTSLAGAGRAGVRFTAAAGADATGLHLDEFVAGGTNAAVVYTHMPAPQQLELEVADWIEGTAFDPTNSDHVANEAHWQAPWYDRDLALSSVTTGATSVSATSTGYARSAGSFVSDGFAVGMWVSASGFTNWENNGASLVTAVSALALTVAKYPQTVTEGAGTRTVAIGFEGQINNQRPIRVRFRPAPPPGALWAGKDLDKQVKLTRHVHLKAVIHDQVVIGEGANWPGKSVEKRTVVNRRLHNDDSTITFVDEGWRRARTLKNSTNAGTTEWIFRPQEFKKDFGRGVEDEPLSFMDYLQIEDVPAWEQQASIAGKHSRLNMAFMAYLFYVSAHCVDRTGRRCWGVNRKYVDKYKITSNAYADWWDPANPTAAATKDTFKAEMPYDPVHQQRRSVFCRQWVGESGWESGQAAKWSLATGTVGHKLLRHLWKDNEVTSTLWGAAWPALDQDNHSAWHRAGGRTELPSGFAALTRQLGSGQSGAATTQLGSGSRRWYWESDPLWIPCTTRDWHPYYKVPPMPDAANEANLPSHATEGNRYAIVDVTAFQSAPGAPNGTYIGRDVAASPTWFSWARDMTRVYDSGSGGLVRFEVGQLTDPVKSDGGRAGVQADSLDYVRQDQTIHFENLRGVYSRDRRPAEAVRRITPEPAYYVNQLGYDDVNVVAARNQQPERQFPRYDVRVSEWFRLAFRTEYLWESGTMFPCDYQGRERLDWGNVWICRFVQAPGDGLTAATARTRLEAAQPAIYYDGGAWAGWKDDHTGFTQANVFAAGQKGEVWMTFDVGPKPGPTADVYMHLVLINERRRTPI